MSKPTTEAQNRPAPRDAPILRSEEEGDQLDAADWIVLLVKRLGKVGEAAELRQGPRMRERLRDLASLTLSCIESFDRRAGRAPAEGEGAGS